MRALVYHGPKKVSVERSLTPAIERPTDALVRITTTNICGSDLHMYEGRTDVEEGKVLGHENMGEVIAVGDGVDRVKVGDMVVPAVQHRLRLLQELRGRADRLLPDRQPRQRRRGLRLRRHGPVQRRPGRAAAGALRGLERAGPARGRAGEGEGLRHAVRHPADRLPRHRAGPGRHRRVGRHLGRGPGRPDGGHVGPAARAPTRSSSSTASPTGSSWPRPARRHPDRRQRGRRRRSRSWTPPAARAPTRASRPSATRPTTTRASETPGPDHQQPDPGRPPDRAHRRRRGVRPRGPVGRGRPGQGRQVRASTSAPSSSRASRWAPGRPTSSSTTGSCAT